MSDASRCLTVILVSTAVLFSATGCIEEPDEGPPPPLPVRTELRVVDGHMTSLDEWYANVTVEHVWSGQAYRVEDIGFFDRFFPVGSPDGPYYRYYDRNEDGLISGNDYIHFTGLTNYHYNNGFNMSAGDEIVVYFELIWDKTDKDNYLVMATSVEETMTDATYWTVEIVLDVRTPGLRLRTSGLVPGYITGDGVALSPLHMVYDDVDGDGFISSGDVVKLSKVTRDYNGCKAQFTYYTQLIGFDWIHLPGA